MRYYQNIAMEASKKDIVWINTVKALGILLVYFFHTEFYMKMNLTSFHSLYTPFFTNCFFFVSGYLLLGRQWNSEYLELPFKKWYNGIPKGSGKEQVSNILFRIAIPTVIFSSLLFIPKIVLRGEPFQIQLFLHDTIFGGSIWFTCSLAVSQLIIWILLAARIKNKLAYLCISVILTIIAVYFAKDAEGNYGTTDVPWFWKGGFVATIYLVGGGIYHRLEQQIHHYLSKIYILLPTLILYILLALYLNSNVLVSINIGMFNSWGALMSFVSILLVIELCRKVPYNKCIEYIGRHTLVLYFMSGAIPNVLALTITKLLGANICTYVACSILSFIVAIPVTIFVNRYVPFLTDIRKFRK